MSIDSIIDNSNVMLASTVLMVPPDGFGFNEQTAESNSYQQNVEIPDVRKRALDEFRNMVAALEKKGVRVLILNQDAKLPDAVFPNNWFSTHLDKEGKTNLVIYPMLTPNRRDEVNIEGLVSLLESAGITIGEVVDLRKENSILEGTGSLVLDHESRTMYALLSNRTEKDLVEKAAKLLGYTPVVFHAVDANNNAIYHTNVMMGVASKFVVVCLECIPDKNERLHVEQQIKKSGKELVVITQDQVNHMCGNVLAVRNNKNEEILLMSSQAYDSFTKEQLELMQKYCQLLAVNIETIETIGGGSARCMMAEIYHE